MAVLTTKYSVGDTVWHASTAIEKRTHPCPDCLGSRKWKATSPAGAEFDVDCPRCGGGYQSSRALDLTYAAHAPLATSLTIGLVKASTEIGDSYDAGNSYMCRETGIGSGTIYRERDLFATKDEALRAAEARANVANLDKAHWVAKQYDESVKFSDYQLKDAEIEAAKSASSSARYAIGYLLEDLEEAESVESVKAAIAAWREKSEAPQ